jgi:hypothetical protein
MLFRPAEREFVERRGWKSELWTLIGIPFELPVEVALVPDLTRDGGCRSAGGRAVRLGTVRIRLIEPGKPHRR